MVIWDFYFPTSGYTHWPLEFGEKPLNPRKGGSTCSLTAKAGGFKEHIQPRYKFKTMPRTSKIESQYSIINALFKGINWLVFFFFTLNLASGVASSFMTLENTSEKRRKLLIEPMKVYSLHLKRF